MAIPLGGKPPSGWSSETYHEDRRAFEHRASATELGKQSLPSELRGTQQFARAANKSALPKSRQYGAIRPTITLPACIRSIMLK